MGRVRSWGSPTDFPPSLSLGNCRFQARVVYSLTDCKVLEDKIIMMMIMTMIIIMMMVVIIIIVAVIIIIINTNI